MKSAIKVTCLVFASVLVSAIVGVAVFGNPAGLSGTDYALRQQALIRTLNTPMPILGAVTILLGLISAFSGGGGRHAFGWWIVGAILMIMAGLVTRFYNQPINAVVMTWVPQALPSNWQSLRDDWWHWHKIRTALSVLGFALFVIGYVRGRCSDREEVSV